jgi:hypothetical protein
MVLVPPCYYKGKRNVKKEKKRKEKKRKERKEG